MLKINKLHHIAIICSDYEKSKKFYTEVLGLRLRSEIYREKRKSYKADLYLGESYLIELFSFPDPPNRLTRPEATGLRHIAFEVADVAQSIQHLRTLNIEVEDIRVDEFTNKKFTFFFDPDNLPIELYEL